ncbi:MAG TPA: hypothetical protein VFF64_28135 [Candidatus Eremiobacteraceae bacterium]|nr:hypothetical protein [Candidatus Eremiobacteraceae bacterium]
MQLGETIATYDLGQALRGESGKFEVTSPAGEIYHVTCRSNHSISSLECAGSRTGSQPFLIRKITEIISANPGNGTASGMIDAETRAGSAGSPFLIENEDDAAGPSHEDSVVVLPNSSTDGFGNSKTAILNLYIESEAASHQPSVWVCVKSSGDRAINADKLLTAPCTNFNELDAEIRKLQAQLDEIRSRARKKFYSAHAAAATA